MPYPNPSNEAVSKVLSTQLNTSRSSACRYMCAWLLFEKMQTLDGHHVAEANPSHDEVLRVPEQAVAEGYVHTVVDLHVGLRVASSTEELTALEHTVRCERPRSAQSDEIPSKSRVGI